MLRDGRLFAIGLLGHLLAGFHTRIGSGRAAAACSSPDRHLVDRVLTVSAERVAGRAVRLCGLWVFGRPRAGARAAQASEGVYVQQCEERGGHRGRPARHRGSYAPRAKEWEDEERNE